MLLELVDQVTSIVLDSVTGFPTTGTNYIQVGSEEISYTGVSGTQR